MSDWFCNRGDFWGTIAQLTLCAKCGKSEHKRPDEARHCGHSPAFHMLCDECWEGLP